MFYCHMRVREVRATHVVVAEMHRDRRVREVGPYELRGLIRRVVHTGRGDDGLHRGAVQAGIREVGAHDPGKGQVRSTQVGTGEISANELDSMQVDPRQVRASQFGTAEVESGEVVPAHDLTGQV